MSIRYNNNLSNNNDSKYECSQLKLNEFTIVTKKKTKGNIYSGFRLLNDKCKIIKDKNIKDKNIKHAICSKWSENGKCNYGKKCLFAHGLNDQNISEDRQTVIKMIKENIDLSDFDLIKNYSVFKSALQLSKKCDMCSEKKCRGGYNCKNGYIDESISICSDDILHGNCHNDDCKLFHLTNKKLIPYKIQKYNLQANMNKLEFNNYKMINNYDKLMSNNNNCTYDKCNHYFPNYVRCNDENHSDDSLYSDDTDEIIGFIHDLDCSIEDCDLSIDDYKKKKWD